MSKLEMAAVMLAPAGMLVISIFELRRPKELAAKEEAEAQSKLGFRYINPKLGAITSGLLLIMGIVMLFVG